MAAPSYTYTLANSTTADADEVMQNFNDILNGVSDGSKDLSISALTVAGAANFNGAVTLGNATGDDLTATGRWAADMDPKTAATYALGSSSLPWQSINIDNGATDGGAVYFGASTTDFLKSDATTGGDLTMGGFTGLDLAANNKIKTFGTEVSANGSFKTADYTVLDTDGLSTIVVDTSSNDVDITLPTASANTGRIVAVKVVDATNTCTIKSDAAGETIDGVSGTTGIPMDAQYEVITVQCDGSDWHKIAAAGTTWQRKVLSASHTTPAGTTTLSDLTFTLTAGSTYRFHLFGVLQNNGTDDNVQLEVKDGSTVLGRLVLNTQVNSGNGQLAAGVSGVIDMAGTSLTVDATSISVGNSLIIGGSTGASTWLTVEELPNHYEGTVS